MPCVFKILNDEYYYDTFTKINFTYQDAVASLKVGNGIKSEGELIISGEKGYIYVPAFDKKISVISINLMAKVLDMKS